ncbi:ATP-binding domain-containing protein [Mobilitalea sibirica]|uniref:ATP-binding domain-containing protein n=1 Tax=Mobilitalea sibirica TaxID=1462919 RepID=A0A8J7KWJ8_9FIRM|nr:3'-5' exonuclease [Mobilitalea sibirica]MBH1940542.1 ATP-binding domain-containing protein [Mobilitalea sibirica]
MEELVGMQFQENNQDIDMETEWQSELRRLEYCFNIIERNIAKYSEELRQISDETKELYDNYRSNNPELHNDLSVGLDIKSQLERILNKSILARKKPYFGRIDYKEKEDGTNFSLYLGKNGVRENSTQSIVVDWRAPVSSVYYESEIGESSYTTPFGETIEIDLELKRTYEISQSELVDFYDSDVVTNDEFLTKYLSKNKEVVLGEIIATIQKEQNEIIRDTPFHSVIVQGVAGSGKTTVAMHRISYILYNYKDKFRPDEFYIIGSNKMLLNYITGVLPNLDVYNINQMTLEEFFMLLLDRDMDIKKGKYNLSNSFMKLDHEEDEKAFKDLKNFKGSMEFFKAIKEYVKLYELDTVETESVIYNNEIIYSKDEIIYFLTFFQDLPLQEKIDLLNKRLTYKITSINEEEMTRKEVIMAEVKKFKNYFGNRSKKINLMEVYLGFLEHFAQHSAWYSEKGIIVPPKDSIHILLQELSHKNIDIYDLGMLTYIKKRLKKTRDFEFISHIIVDEAQDFGVIIFAIMKELFKNCTYTIMGDVSQNINYHTGMNDWETLKQEVFLPEKDKFYVLAKSYRNTVEISEYASKVLKKCSFRTYEIEPIIRHGKEVTVYQAKQEENLVSEAVRIIQNIKKNGYDTIAVICRTVDETLKVQSLLDPYLTTRHYDEDIETMTFTNGVMVLPIHMTKGLEFDAVVIWNPDEISYQARDEDAKLLYVAITRALHELYIVYQGSLTRLLC